MQRRGFTLVELLIVIAIIGILISLLLPAVSGVRESARMSTCRNNLKQVSLAMHSFHEARGRLPTGAASWGWRPCWPARVLHYIEQSAAQELADLDATYYTSTNEQLISTRFAVYTCPSDVPRSRANGWTKHNYVVNAGNTGWIQGEGADVHNTRLAEDYNGVTHGGAPFSRQDGPDVTRPKITFASIRDGLSNTLMMSEVVQGDYSSSAMDLRGFIWWGPAATFETYLPPNTSQPDVYPGWCDTLGTVVTNPPCISPHTAAQPMTGAARSRHPGGVHASLCDGSVRFISDDIELDTWRALSTSQGGETVAVP